MIMRHELITDAVLVRNYIDGDENALSILIYRHKQKIYSFIYSKIAARPVFSGGITGVIILLLSALLFFNQPQQPSKQYSKAEIELAQKQLSKSMAIVNRVFKNAEQQFDKKVVPNIINKNTDKGFNLINDLLIGG